MKRLLLLLLLLASPAMAQVSVSLSPVPHMQFLNNNGVPLANGCVFTYAAGTTTPAATYIDSFGVTQNANPIILDAGGFANIWLPNAAFKFKVVSAGGVNCASGVTQWTVDNISGVLGLLNLNNTFTGTNTFTQPITITPNSNQIVLGTAGNQTTLNAPAPAGNITINFPSVASTLAPTVNAALTTPSIGGINNTNGPGTYMALANEGATGTGINLLAKATLGTVPSTVILPLTTDTGGILGICVAGCGTAGTATIQQSGQVNCTFDGAPTTGGDYVRISPTTAGQCEDAGATYPTIGQVIGRIIGNGGGGNPKQIDLFGPEIRSSSGSVIGCTNFTPVIVSNSVAATALQSCVIPANTLIQGSVLSIDLTGVESESGGAPYTISLATTFGGSVACTTTSAATGVGTNQPWNAVVKLSVLTSGAAGSGNMSCEYFSSTAGGGTTGPFGAIGLPTFVVNTTVANTILVTLTMSVANANNIVTEQMLKAVIF